MESHINTFENGMNKDYNILYQPNGTYRNCINCQLISHNGNNYTITDCLGNTRVFQINIPFSFFTAGTPPTVTYQAAPMPIGFISFPNKLVVFSTNDETEGGGYGEIGIIRYTTYGEGIQPIINLDSPTVNTYKGYVPLYHNTNLKFTKLKQIEGFAFEENDSIQRVYWTDNLNQPRVFNVADSTFTTYIPSGSLIVGQQYMVIEGAITHNSLLYSPDYTNDTTPPVAPNVFTAVNANYTDESISFVGAKVIAYYPFELLNWTPDRDLGNINFDSYGSGSKNCGDNIYFYKLGKLGSGVYTSWSYGSSPIHVGTNNNIITGNPYHDFVGSGNATTLVASVYSIKVNISNVNTIYDTIQLACAEYDQLIDVPTSIKIVNETPINSTTLNIDGSMTLEDTGTVDLGTLTLDDITLFPASILKIKTLTTNKNYNLIGNITERTEFSETITASISTFQYPLIEQGDNDTCSNLVIFDNVGPTAFTSANPGINDIVPNSRWLVSLAPGVGNRVEYPVGSGTFYYTGDVFVGVTGSYTATFTGTAQARPCVNQNRYTPITPFPGTLSSQRNNAIPFKNTAFWDYKNPAVAHHVRGYWSNEKYRIGILCFDLKGNPFYVRWLNDVTFPDISTKGGLMISDTSVGGSTQYSLNPSGLKLNITIPGSLIDKISGFSIVRAERDARILAQGMVDVVLQDGATPNTRTPEPTMNYGTGIYAPAVGHYTYTCPDWNVSYPFSKPFGIVGDSMEEACWLGPYDFGGLVYYRNSFNSTGLTDGNSIVAKFTNQLPSDQYSLRKVTLQSLNGNGFQPLAEGDLVTNYDGPNNNFYNYTQLGSLGGINTVCSGLNFSLVANQRAAGNLKLIWKSGATVSTPANFNHYQSASGYSSVDKNLKIMMNCCKNILPANQYGGSDILSLANTTYISTGHYQPINETVKYETLSGSDYVFNNVDVWGGDCYTCYVDNVYVLWDDQSISNTSYAITNFFPCECNSNYNLRRGYKATTVDTFPARGTNSIVWNDAGRTQLESFNCNEAYSTDGVNFKYPALPINYSASGKFRYRIRFAGPKFIGELIDSFRVFLTNDYKDISGEYGEINNLRERNASVFVWQNLAISTVPILERQILTGLSGAPTTLGTGGVVDRWDVINSYFGNSHQFGLTKTEYGFCWFDIVRKAVVVLDINSGIIEISKVDGLKSFFDEVIVDNLGDTSSFAPQPVGLNSVTFDEKSDRPLIGVGITGVYDPKLKMTYITFKWKNIDSSNHNIVINKGFTIGYYHLGKIFTGFYDWFPAISWNHDQIVISVNNPKNKTKYYGVGMPSTSFVVGETVKVASVEYVCITNVVVASYPGTAGTSGTNPITGTDNWMLLNVTNEIFVHNQPTTLSQTVAPDYIYNTFFNLVVDNEIEFVINPKTANPFSVLSIEQKGNNVNYTDVYIDAEGVTAADNSITATNRFYRWIYDRIASNLPLSLTGRITNSYLKIRMVKKNWTTNPTVLTGSVKILQQIISKFQQKR